jgi:hypothetical protein
MNNQVQPVSWEVGEIHDGYIMLDGFDKGGEKVAEREYTINKTGTGIKQKDGEWAFVSLDDGLVSDDLVLTGRVEPSDGW